MLSDLELEVANQDGIFLLPEDSYESYCHRVHKLRQNSISPSPALVRDLYEMNPQWVEVVYSNKELYFWEAACNWLEGDKTWIQMRRSFEKKKRLFGLYTKEEVLSHEYVHAVRAQLQSEKYEEYFAYYVSKGLGSRWRSILGPLFSTPLDAKLFIISLISPPCLLFLDLCSLEISLAIPLCMIVFFTIRLLWRWHLWHCCRVRVGLALMVRLTDEEIDCFSRLTTSQINGWMEEAQKTSFRWQQLSKWYRI